MKKYQSEALKVIHQDAEGLHRLGIISDKEMREYDRGCLVQEPETSPAAPRTAVIGSFAQERLSP
jgi:DNA-binding transcriptional regulator YiaG